MSLVQDVLAGPSAGGQWIRRLVGRRDMDAVLGGATRVLAIRLVGAALAYISMALMARWLGPFYFGIYAYVWVWIVTFGIVLSLGYYYTALRFIPDYLARARWHRLHGFLNHSCAVVSGTGLAGALACAALIWTLRASIEPHYFLPLLIGAACLPLSALLNLLESVARAFGWVGLAYGPGYVLRPLILMVAIGAAIGLGFSPTAVEALLAVFAACVVAVLVQGVLILRDRRRRIPRAAPAYTNKWLTISLSFLIIEGFRLLLENADVMMIGKLLDPHSVAIYFAAIRTGGLIAFIYFAVAALAVPRISQIHATGTRAEMQSFVSGIIRLMFWPTVAAALVMALLGPFALSLFGAGFAGGYSVLLVVLFGLVVRAALGPVEFLLNMTGHQADTVRIYALAAIADLGLNLVLIPRLGVLGAAIATFVAVIGANVSLCVLVRRRLGVTALVFR